MRLIAWNLNHRTREKVIPREVPDFFARAGADMIALNEYVDGPSREAFKSELQGLGYCCIHVSATEPGHNQVLIASRIETVPGELPGPQMDASSRSNFLHVRVPSNGIEVVAFRAPWYKRKSERSAYWQELRGIMASAGDRPVCFIGDANYDPFAGLDPDSPAEIIDEGSRLRVPRPAGEWSYISMSGTIRSRIDHAFLTAKLSAAAVEYITSHEGILLAGPASASPVSDHAALSLKLLLSPPGRGSGPVATSSDTRYDH